MSSTFYLPCEKYLEIKEKYESLYGQSYYGVEKKFFEWMYLKHPYHHLLLPNNQFTSFCFSKDSTITACINFVVTKIYITGKEHITCSSVSSFSTPQNSTHYSLLLKQLSDQFDFYLSFGPTEAIEKLYVEKLKFQSMPTVPRSVAILDEKQLIPLLQKNPLPLLPCNAVQIKKWAEESRTHILNATYFRLKDSSQLIPKYWEEHLKNSQATMDKSPEIIKWRYFSHPIIQYHIISTTPEQASGLAIIRIEQSRGLAQYPFARLVEFIPTSGNEEVLAQSVLAFCAEKECVFIDFFCGSNQMLSRLPLVFKSFETHSHLEIPRLLAPIEWRKKKSITSLLKINRKKNDPNILNFNNLYFTKGEADQDVLVNSNHITPNL